MMQMQQHFHHQQPIVFLSEVKPDDSFRPKAAIQMAGLSITQIIMGCFCLILGVTLIPLDMRSPDDGSGIAYIGYGIWFGTIFIIQGIIGVRAAKSKSGCLITVAMVANIIFSAVGCVFFVGFTSVGLYLVNSDRCFRDQVNDCDKDGIKELFRAFDGMMLVMALIEFVVNIWTAVLCCGAVCRCCKWHRIGATIQFIARPNQVLVQPMAFPNGYGQGFHPSHPGVGMQLMSPRAAVDAVHNTATQSGAPQTAMFEPPSYSSIAARPAPPTTSPQESADPSRVQSTSRPSNANPRVPQGTRLEPLPPLAPTALTTARSQTPPTLPSSREPVRRERPPTYSSLRRNMMSSE